MTRFHRWYDTLQEPWRVGLLLLIVLLFVILPLQSQYPIPRAGVFIGLYLGISRALYVYRRAS